MEENSDRLKAFFKDKGLTQEQVASMLGVSQAYVNSLLTGNKAFGKKQAKRFEELFGISQTWLLTGKGDMVVAGVYQSNQNGNNIHGNTVNYQGENSTEKLIEMLKKKDEQIDRLLSLLEMKYGQQK